MRIDVRETYMVRMMEILPGFHVSKANLILSVPYFLR